MTDKYLKASEVAKMYNTSSVTVRSWIKSGLLPNSKFEESIAGSVWLILESDLKDFQKPDRGRPKKTKEDETLKENPASGLEREN
jgi:Helix-turn-helix domain